MYIYIHICIYMYIYNEKTEASLAHHGKSDLKLALHEKSWVH